MNVADIPMVDLVSNINASLWMVNGCITAIIYPILPYYITKRAGLRRSEVHNNAARTGDVVLVGWKARLSL